MPLRVDGLLVVEVDAEAGAIEPGADGVGTDGDDSLGHSIRR
ncbi:MAG TPA: hypothetical protein VFO16_24625 [Pseudonocardiaceae bacterium]|nr:hypothetical protein [Pseudonocardiaceae bacterium]